ISQGFFGQFSHLDPGNRHAVDIAMPMGTNIVAARPGTVAIAKDDYPMSGVRRFFLDKANHITVLHQDGSYAVYAHILQGSAKVKPGDKVVSGQALARSGSSGYSTGPHLHFVVQHNAGGGTASVPFQFKSPKGGHFTPRQGQKLQSF
ncbi:MAG: M23 family metallopeptidase, partial [Cellvibrionaceae bacterium]|nr:M23 family metallopeptidase [Cellvibrionaceae bacterium]